MIFLIKKNAGSKGLVLNLFSFKKFSNVLFLDELKKNNEEILGISPFSL